MPMAIKLKKNPEVNVSFWKLKSILKDFNFKRYLNLKNKKIIDTKYVKKIISGTISKSKEKKYAIKGLKRITEFIEALTIEDKKKFNSASNTALRRMIVIMKGVNKIIFIKNVDETKYLYSFKESTWAEKYKAKRVKSTVKNNDRNKVEKNPFQKIPALDETEDSIWEERLLFINGAMPKFK